MFFLVIIIAALLIGTIWGVIGRAKSEIEVKQELEHLEELKKSRKTHAPSYSIGSLYSRGDEEGMVVATNSNGRHGRFVDFSAKGTKYYTQKALDSWSVTYNMPNYAAEANAEKYKKGYWEIPTIEDLRTFGRYLDYFYQMRDERRTGGIYGNFPDVRFEDLGLARRIISRDLTPDTKSVYAYDIATKSVVTLPISNDDDKYDDEDITCGVILVGFF